MKKLKGVLLIILLFLIVGESFCGICFFRWNLQITTQPYEESSKAVTNPNRGFYTIYSFYIEDEMNDCQKQLQQQMAQDKKSIALIELNIRNYMDRPLTEQALQNVDQIFREMSKSGKTWIVRFLYDWDGKNEEKEPDHISVITNHMTQLEKILRQNKNSIFTLQGIFVGNWGEMNGTKYTEKRSLNVLMDKLANVTDPSTFLSVRTPAQWRQITGKDNGDNNRERMEGRLGLFNDGMLASKSDYGTYGNLTKADGIDVSWTREEELHFQDKLCQNVPNGGEVIVDNYYNDIDNAIKDLKTMHVTYINEAYDKKVFDKWASSTVHTNDCFDGMDGLSYIERHLGYRLVLSDPKMTYNVWKDTLHVELSLKNVGFAPVYKACDGIWTVKNEDGEVICRKKMTEKVTKLTGGNQNAKVLSVTKDIPLKRKKGKKFYVYFSIKDRATGKMIVFGNEQEETKDGYLIGTLASETEMKNE